LFEIIKELSFKTKKLASAEISQINARSFTHN